MSSPILFFIVVIVIDLILKSVRDKKKIEENKMDPRDIPKDQSGLNKEKPIRDIMSTLREEVEKERQKQLERRNIKPQKENTSKIVNEEQVIAEKTYEDNKYWEEKRRLEDNKKIEAKKKTQELSVERSIRENLISGIILSEILAEPKSIQNKKNSM